MSEHDNLEGTSDQSESDEAMSEDGPLELRSKSTKALKTPNERLHRWTCQKNPMIRYGYDEYMAHHYVYMKKVAEKREPQSYVEVT